VVGRIFPQIFSGPTSEVVRWILTRFGGAKMLRTSAITMSSLVGLRLHVLSLSVGWAKKFDVCFLFAHHGFE